MGLTVIVNVVTVAHWPLVGVYIYVVIEVLFNAGDHVPVMPFKEVVGKAVNVPPLQMGATAEKIGVTLGLTVIVRVVALAH